jgi:hypothetical protein
MDDRRKRCKGKSRVDAGLAKTGACKLWHKMSSNQGRVRVDCIGGGGGDKANRLMPPAATGRFEGGKA